MGFDFNKHIDCTQVQYCPTISDIVNQFQQKFDEGNYVQYGNTVKIKNYFDLIPSDSEEDIIEIHLKTKDNVILPILFELWYLNYHNILPWVSLKVVQHASFNETPSTHMAVIIPQYFERNNPYYTHCNDKSKWNISYILEYMKFLNHIGQGELRHYLLIGKSNLNNITASIDDVFKFITYILMHPNEFSNFIISPFIIILFEEIEKFWPFAYKKHELYDNLKLITSLVDYCRFFYEYMLLPIIKERYPNIYKSHIVKVDGTYYNDLPVFDCYILLELLADIIISVPKQYSKFAL